jgi:outer membrane protein
MKKIFFAVMISFFSLSASSFAQLKIAYVDSKAIMDNLPDAQDAKQKLDDLIKQWQTELSKMESDYRTKLDDFQKRKLIMTDQTRNDMQTELDKMKKDIDDYREQKFGTNGEVFQKQDELMKPVQNKVFNVIQDIAKEEDYDYVLDKSGDVMILYAKDKYDITQQVLDKLK